MFYISIFFAILTIFLFIAQKKFGAEFKFLKFASVAALIVAVVMFFSSCITTIGAGEVGVKSLFGQVDNEYLTSGLHFVNPLVKVHRTDIRTQEYTLSKSKSEGKPVEDAIATLTSDGMTIELEVTAWYRASEVEAPNLYRTVGPNYNEVIVRPAIRSIIRDVCVGYTAIDLYSAKREQFAIDVTNKMTALLATKGIILEKMLLRDVELPEKVRISINEKIAAEQEAQKMVFVLQKEKQEAERKRIEAGGIRDFQKIVSEGISDALIKWKWIEAMEKLAASNNTKVIFMNGKDAGVMIGGSQF